MLLTLPKFHNIRYGITTIPLWIIGGLFLYIFTFINLNDEAILPSIEIKSAADISNIEKRLPRHNALSFLKQPLFTAKTYSVSFKFDNLDNGKNINLVRVSSLLLTFNVQRSAKKNNKNGFIQHIFTATQRAPPSFINPYDLVI